MGGVPGAALTRSARKTPWSREWRGIFIFPPQHQTTMEKLADAEEPIVLEGTIEGRESRLDVTVTGLAPGGLAFFEADGEPY